jgi:hypothetical protein
MFILDSITPRETKETGVGETKKSELEDPGTFEENNDVSTLHYINITLFTLHYLHYIIYIYIIFINVSLITISTTVSIYFGMEWNLQLSKSNS